MEHAQTETESERTFVLRLREPERRVTFAADTIDNEHMGKKKSKSNLYAVCCIYRKKNREESSDSSDEDINDYEYQPDYRKKQHRCNH